MTGRFSFKPEARADLLRCFPGRNDIVTALEEAVSKFSELEENLAKLPKDALARSFVTAKTRRELLSLSKSIHRAVRQVESLSWAASMRLPSRIEEMLKTAAEVVQELAKELPKAGAPVDYGRQALVMLVANVLEDHGVKLTVGPTGKFGRTLGIVLKAAVGTAPRDLRPVLIKCVTLGRFVRSLVIPRVPGGV
jgi:uncharacterized protein Yka (UPF0111/DUF47 family)